MKKILILLVITGFVFNSCSSNDSLISKRPTKVEFTDYYTRGNLTESSVYGRFSISYVYDEENKLIEQNFSFDNGVTRKDVFVYKNGKLVEKNNYDTKGEIEERTFYEYQGENIVRSVNKRRSYSDPKVFLESIDEYTYDAQSRLIKLVHDGFSNSLDYTRTYEYLPNNVIKEVRYSGAYILNELEDKKNPFYNVSSYASYSRMYPLLFNVKSSKSYYANNNVLKSEIEINKNTYDGNGFLKKEISVNDNGHTYVTEFIY